MMIIYLNLQILQQQSRYLKIKDFFRYRKLHLGHSNRIHIQAQVTIWRVRRFYNYTDWIHIIFEDVIYLIKEILHWKVTSNLIIKPSMVYVSQVLFFRLSVFNIFGELIQKSISPNPSLLLGRIRRSIAGLGWLVRNLAILVFELIAIFSTSVNVQWINPINVYVNIGIG